MGYTPDILVVGNTFSFGWAMSATNANSGSAIVVQPRIGDQISTGVAQNQAVANATNRTAVVGGGFTRFILTDSVGALWGVDAYKSHVAVITAGTGIGEARFITGNTNTVLTVEPGFSVTPDATTRFEMRLPIIATPVIMNMTIDHTAVAGTLSLYGMRFVSGTATYSNLNKIQYNSGAATTGTRTYYGPIVGDPNSDLRLKASVAGPILGSVTASGYWVNSDSVIQPLPL